MKSGFPPGRSALDGQNHASTSVEGLRVASADLLSGPDSSEVSEVTTGWGRQETLQEKASADHRFVLHPIHFKAHDELPAGFRSVTSAPFGQIALEGCMSASMLAKGALKTTGEISSGTCLQMHFQVCSDLLQSIDVRELCVSLRLAEVGIAQESSSIVVAVVEDRSQWQAAGDSETDMQFGMCGWLFEAIGASVTDVHNILKFCGCYFSELSSLYELHVSSSSFLAHGSFGTVVRGNNKGDYAMVAVKVMKSKVKRKAVLRESDILAISQGSPHIVKFFGCFVDFSLTASCTHRWSLVFDFHRQGDLYDFIRDGSALEEETVMFYFRGILMALKHLSARGVFHRDVKPENLLIAQDHQLILCDFGVATLVSDTEAMKDCCSGSLGYSSPEMLCGEATGCHGDAWSAGVVLYFMFSKSTPFLADSPGLISKKTMEGRVNLNYRCFRALSQAPKDLILGLIEIDIRQRMTPEQALAFCFMHGCCPPPAV